DSRICSQFSSISSHSTVEFEFRATFRGICKW
ncbi:hypothetical protein A2U01_0051728, partial [Trifolium medium]|nr:hypothetical protein [Trifolium medium]